MWCKIFLCIPVPNLKRIWLHFGGGGELWPKNHPKAPKNGIFYWSENNWTFITWQPQMSYRWNLPRLYISMRPFITQKLESHPWGVRGRTQKTAKKCHEIHQVCNLTSRKNSLKNAMKVGFFLLSSRTIWL